MRIRSKRLETSLWIPVLAALLACRDGGANQGQRAPGDQPGGVLLGLGDIAVSPSDDYVLFERDDGLAVGWTRTGRVEMLPVADPTRLAFSKQRQVVYVGSDESTDRVLAVDVEGGRVLWSASVSDAGTASLRLAASADDRVILAADVDAGTVQILDGGTGAQRESVHLGGDIVDIQILPDDERALAVLRHEWDEGAVTTRVVVIALGDGKTTEIDVPNCSDRVAVSKEGDTAFLAPTTCIDPAEARAKDPISLLDLSPGSERFVKNLPGFGPVAVSPEGTTAVGFLDMNALDRALFDDESRIPDRASDRYHLMLIDVASLDYRFVEVGSKLPRFAITPDGNVLLVDSSWTLDVPARLFDVHASEWRYITGAPLLLDDFVIASDSRHAYVIESRYHEGLYDLDIGEGTSTEIGLSFAPRNINIAPSDETLYLRKSDTEVCVFSLATRRCETELEAPTFVARQ